MVALVEKYTEALDSVKYLKWHHDVGFMIDAVILTVTVLQIKKNIKM